MGDQTRGRRASHTLSACSPDRGKLSTGLPTYGVQPDTSVLPHGAAFGPFRAGPNSVTMFEVIVLAPACGIGP